MPDCMVVGVDDSDCRRSAALFAATHASRATTSLTLVYVVEWSPYTIYSHEELETRHREREEEIDRAQKRALDPLVAELGPMGIEITSQVRHGHASRVLIEVAREVGATQIIVGRRGRSKIAEVIFGSTASSLVQASPIPVTVVP